MENTLASSPAEQERYRRAKSRVKSLRGFYIHLTVYLLVNTGLLGINMLTTRDVWWWQWSALGWGIGLAAHAFSALVSPGLLGHEWEERKIREILSRERHV